VAERLGVRVTGRESELALLARAVTDLRGGRGRAVLIEGEAGIGKSALLNAALAGLDPDGCGVVRAVCDELTEQFPLSAVTQALDSDTLRGGGRQVPAGPAVRLGLTPEDPVLGAVEELLGLIHRLCADRPLILALEDMHWADKASVLLWRRLCRVTSQLPLLLIATRRPLPRGAPLERDVAGRGGIVLTLTGLTAGDVARMTADLVGGTPGPRLLDWLEPAAGNPFYVRELLDAALRSGAVLPASEKGVVELAERPGAGDGLGGQVTSLRQAVASRLDFLSAEALQVLRIASLLGPDFPVTDLAAVTGQTPTGLLPVVEDAIAAGLLEEAGTQLRFRHGLLQQALYEGMPIPLRAALHRQAAQSLIGLRASTERVARQLLAVPDLGEEWEMDWLAANAADLASRVPEVAASLSEQALRRITPGDPRQAVLEDQLTGALFALGRYEQAGRLTAAILLWVTDPDRHGYLTWTHIYTLIRGGRPGDAVTALDAAAARPGTTELWQARFLSLRAIALYDGPSKDAALEAALDAATRLGDPVALTYALQAEAVRHFLAHRFVPALHSLDQALALATDDPRLTDLRLLLILNWVSLATELGRFDEAWALAEQTLADYELSGSPRLGPLRQNAAMLAYETGRWDEAVAKLDALADTEDQNLDQYTVRALIAGHRDDWPEAGRQLAAISSGADEIAAGAVSHTTEKDPTVSLVAATLLESERAGDLSPALTLLADWLGPGRDQRVPFWYKLLPRLTRLALAAPDEAAARAAAQAAQAETGQEPRARREAVARWCAGLVAENPAIVRDAARTLRELGLPLDAANALEDAAVGFAQAGDAETARAVLADTLRIYDQLGAAWDARRATARIRPHGIRLSRRGRQRRPQTGWRSLTATEVQVAELLAEGRSNPDIAAQLFVSRRTVESHVSHILAKLQLTSRWEVKAAAH